MVANTGREDPDPPKVASHRLGVISNLENAHAALERPLHTKEQIEDAIRSAEFFIAKAKEQLGGASG